MTHASERYAGNDDLDCIVRCTHLVTALAQRLDHSEFEALADLFHEDGAVQLDAEVQKGREQILNKMASRPKGRITRHIVSTVNIERISETEARGRAYGVVYRANDTGETPSPLPPAAMLVEYHDKFTFEGGAWKIKQRRILRIMGA